MKIMSLGVKMVFLALFATLAASFTLHQESAGWELLGMRKINYGLDRDEIIVTRAEGTFNAIKLRVKRSPINMHKLVVHYGNGETHEVELRNNFAAGSESRVIDLPGAQRVIKKVVFWYDTKNLAGRKGVIELWGRH